MYRHLRHQYRCDYPASSAATNQILAKHGAAEVPCEAMEAHHGTVEVYYYAWWLIMVPRRLTKVPWRLTMELWRLTMEPWRPTMAPWRLTMVPWRLTRVPWSHHGSSYHSSIFR
jgi:hypothetical protein